MERLQHIGEAGIVLLSIHWQPVFGILLSCCGAWYYIAMIKMNVVDKNHKGSWRQYFIDLLKNKK